MISEGSCDWSNFLHLFKEKTFILNNTNISKFYCILDQINVGLVGLL